MSKEPNKIPVDIATLAVFFNVTAAFGGWWFDYISEQTLIYVLIVNIIAMGLLDFQK